VALLPRSVGADRGGGGEGGQSHTLEGEGGLPSALSEIPVVHGVHAVPLATLVGRGVE
jgi:hypothetical protein